MILIRYLGGKSRILKDIVPILQDYSDKCDGYIEPFVGGANVIEHIKNNKKMGSDIDKYLISLLKKVQSEPEDLPERITFEEYEKVRNNRDNYPMWYVGLVGYTASYGGKFFGGYARHFHGDNSGDISAGSIKALKKQNLKDIEFLCCDFREYQPSEIKGKLFYCDIPYKNATKYKSCLKFPYDLFYNWCKEIGKNNFVIVSEYEMPDDFKCIWEGKTYQLLDSKKLSGESLNRTEKLFICG